MGYIYLLCFTLVWTNDAFMQSEYESKQRDGIFSICFWLGYNQTFLSTHLSLSFIPFSNLHFLAGAIIFEVKLLLQFSTRQGTYDLDSSRMRLS